MPMQRSAGARRAPLALTLLALVLFTGCLESTGVEDEGEPEIAAVSLLAPPSGTVASGQSVVTATGQAGTLTLRAGVANVLVARVFGEDGADEPVVSQHAAEYEIRLFTADGTPVPSTISDTYPYFFTVTPAAATGAMSYKVQVYAVDHGHHEFETQVPMTVNVVAP